MIPNVLAERYASPTLKEIWSPEGRILLERELWLAVARAQKDLGLDIPAEALEAYEAVKNQIDLPAIDARERITRHDVKARIEEFNDLAGHEQLHKGMTSRDLTENVEQLQVYRSLLVIRDKTVAALARIAKLATETEELVITGRTHNVAAQSTTFGKRLTMFGEELIDCLGRLEHLIATYCVRGLKGAVGTQLDQLSLFDGDSAKVAQLEKSLAAHLGIPDVWENVGQVYPRSLDFSVVSALVEIGSAPSSFAKTLRLMAGHETASEGFAPGQTGSSAMPHKMNSRSCSVVRRVMLPDAFFASDGMFETLLTILDQIDTYPAVIEKENLHYLPFLLTTTIMMAAVKAGVGRETAHHVIKEHALATVNDLLERLAADDRLPLDLPTLQNLLEENKTNTGNAPAQIQSFTSTVAELVAKHPTAASYTPGDIL